MRPSGPWAMPMRPSALQTRVRPSGTDWLYCPGGRTLVADPCSPLALEAGSVPGSVPLISSASAWHEPCSRSARPYARFCLRAAKSQLVASCQPRRPRRHGCGRLVQPCTVLGISNLYHTCICTIRYNIGHCIYILLLILSQAHEQCDMCTPQ